MRLLLFGLFNQQLEIFSFGDANAFLYFLQVLITRRLILSPIQVRSIGGKRIPSKNAIR